MIAFYHSVAKPQPKIEHRLRRLSGLKIFVKKARSYKFVFQSSRKKQLDSLQYDMVNMNPIQVGKSIEPLLIKISA
jgi:hypothetical protein